MRRVSIIGIVVGGVTDIVSTNLLTLPVLVYAIVRLGPEHANQSALTSALQRDHGLLALTFLIIGLGCSVLGGYVAGWIAKHDEVLNGALSSFLCVACGIIGLLLIPAQLPSSQHILGLIISPTVAAFGGYLRLIQRRRSAELLSDLASR